MNLEFVNALKNAASTVSVVTSNGKFGMAGATISSMLTIKPITLMVAGLTSSKLILDLIDI